jgi:hypothetical protein
MVNKSSQNVAKFKYILKDNKKNNTIHEKIECRFVCCLLVLCLIVVPLPPGETPFAVKVNNNSNNNNNNNLLNAVTIFLNLFSFGLLFIQVGFKIKKSIFLSVVLYGCDT